MPKGSCGEEQIWLILPTILVDLSRQLVIFSSEIVRNGDLLIKSGDQQSRK